MAGLKLTPDDVISLIFSDLMNKRGLDISQILCILKCTEGDFESLFSPDKYFPPEKAVILSKAFGYSQLFLLTGEGDMYVDFRNDNEVYDMWKNDKLKRLHLYLYRMSRCWNHPKAIEIFDTYDKLQRSNSKVEILLLNQKIESLFNDLLLERDSKLAKK